MDIKRIILEEIDDLEWIRDIEPSWLRLGQKFINKYHLGNKDEVQVGSNTFEIFDINERNGTQYLKFTHNDVLDGYERGIGSWDMDREKNQNYNGLSFEQAKRNIDTGFWIPLVDCRFVPSERGTLRPRRVAKYPGEPYGQTYCKPNTEFKVLQESKDFQWIKDTPADFPSDEQFLGIELPPIVIKPTLHSVVKEDYYNMVITFFLEGGRYMEIVNDSGDVTLHKYMNIEEFGEELSFDWASEEDFMREFPAVQLLSEQNAKLDNFLKERFHFIREIYLMDI